MKPIVLTFLAFLFVFNLYAQNCVFSKAPHIAIDDSEALITNLNLLLYRSLPIYTINMKQDVSDIHRKMVLKNNKSSAGAYNQFLNDSDTRTIWTPLLGVAHEFGHSITIHPQWFHHLLQPWDKDLKADYLSGYILRKLGASIQECRDTFIVTVNEFPLRNPHNNNRRLNALIAGYFRAVYNF